MKRPPRYRHLMTRLLWWDAPPLIAIGVMLTAFTALCVLAGFAGAALR